ncbi:trypsin-like peptidase domain-containing protein [Flavihumibacter petaseus]|uniref:Serine endoprotease n=1 Tax=Flavihumibacter petaseus NBRC 106054 TaxID=1220578 RepID=A0A0E9MZL1_9BACT|nr:trypsin-like peptidase domain-containing protein [Flavihumibacter petaseus]GAO43187.1 serine endoprotease [Flavihumibacter petaseus NBRC 106054]
MTLQKALTTTLVLGGLATGSVWAYKHYRHEDFFAGNQNSKSLFENAKYTDSNGSTVATPMVDFEKAATKASPAVVHIKTVMRAQRGATAQIPDQLRDFFGDGFGDEFGGGGSRQAPAQRASGSGVLITADGYIVTNNHVVADATELTVTLNNKKDFRAKVVGTDPSTDLAVIKIEGKDLPYLRFTNSDDVHLGQWVLAIGYPLNLETTVTSGIVSAKARNIGINSRNSRAAIESFIQTDAAVNPGNSGGALVNTEGDLIGINSAIASPTGSYAGYAYAIPSNLAQRVANDIIKYGSAKRAYLGISFPNDQLSEEERTKNNIKEGKGVYVMEVAGGSAAAEAGIRKGDFITALNGAEINSGTELMGKVGALRPGDKIDITYSRDNAEKTVTATLKGNAGAYAASEGKAPSANQLGATFENLGADDAAQLNLRAGVVVKDLGDGILSDQTRIREGFIITKVNGRSVGSVEQLNEALQRSGNSALITGVYPNNPREEYQYALNDLNR